MESPFKEHAIAELKALTQLRIQSIDRFRECDRCRRRMEERSGMARLVFGINQSLDGRGRRSCRSRREFFPIPT
jgi:hypothetical protein